MKTFNTSVAISPDKRTVLCTHLNGLLASSLDLFTQVKQAHWNIKGPQFFARHLLFDKLADRLQSQADELAERVATLGGYAEGTARLVAKHSHLDEYDLNASDGRAHLMALRDRYASFTKAVRQSNSVAKEVGDPATEDLTTAILRDSELDMWFVESHLND